MMFNPYVMKKYLALGIMGFIPAGFMYSALLLTKNVWLALGLFFGCLLICIPICVLTLKNAFSNMLEGKGMLLLTLDSTGSIAPFNVSLDPSRDHVRGKVWKIPFRHVFDRNTIFDLKTPEQAVAKKDETTGEVIICKVPPEKANKLRFQFNTFPVFLYNPQLGSFYTRDWFGNEERVMYANHLLLYLNKKMEELTSLIRDFARYIAEQLKPKSMWGGGWAWIIWIIVIALIGGLIYMAWPSISQAFGGVVNSDVSIIPSGSAIIPGGG